VNRFIGYSQVVSTSNCSTLRITITVTHKIKSSTSILNPLEFSLSNAISESESYVTTDGQSARLSWNKTPIWGLRPDLNYCLTVAGLLIWGTLSDERTGLSFAIATGPRQCSHFLVRVP
jgi:hypothetical protein